MSFLESEHWSKHRKRESQKNRNRKHDDGYGNNPVGSHRPALPSLYQDTGNPESEREGPPPSVIEPASPCGCVLAQCRYGIGSGAGGQE